MSNGSWSAACDDFAGRERVLQVLVRGGEVVIVVPAGEIAKLGPAAAVGLGCVVEQAAEVANPSGVGASGRCLMEIGAAGAAEQDRDEMPLAVAGQAARLSCRGRSGPWASGPAAMLTATGGGG